MKTIQDHLKKLTFDDLHAWAGEKIVERAKGYVSRVGSLSHTGEDELAAWVRGSERYATAVQFAAKGKLHAFCTCPYDWGTPCKHAVALVLAAAEQIKQGKAMPLLDEASRLARVLEDGGDFDADEDEDGYEDDEWPDAPASSSRRQKRPSPEVLQAIVQNWSQDQLVALLLKQAGRDAALAQQIVEAGWLDSGREDKLVSSLRKEIRQLTAEPAWLNSWNDDGHLPDYSHLLRQLQTLLDRGHYDALLELGEELWQAGNAQVEQSDDEGETAMAIAECLEVVLAALPHSSLPPAERLIWLIDHLLEDDFELLHAGEQVLESEDYRPKDWQMAARSLQALLATATNRYRRTRIVGRLVEAYLYSGGQDQIIPLLEREADACQNYEQLVDALLATGARDQARQWCIHGYAQTMESASGIAARLRVKLHELAQEEERHDLAAAYRAEAFFDAPTLASYGELHAAAEQTGHWPAVRTGALAFLESGQRPDLASDVQTAPCWPLPPSELAQLQREPKPTFRRFPELDLLIDIAIQEQRLDEVVALYRRLPQQRGWGRQTEQRVAEAVAGSHPNIALAIWRGLVDALIAKVQPSAYVEAGGYLRRMHEVYEAIGCGDAWQALLIELRATHKAKRRLQEVLDGLNGGRLVD